jgi:tetratricopeptide (TPR) repeat protein
MSRLKEFEERKDVGNHFMKLQQYEQARDIYYSILLDIANDISYQEIEIACLNNLSSLFYGLKNYDEVVNLTSKILEMELGNEGEKKKVKALYRQGQAYEQLGYMSIAMERISKLLEIEPKNQQAKDYLMKLMNRNSGEITTSSPSPAAAAAVAVVSPTEAQEEQQKVAKEVTEESSLFNLNSAVTQDEAPTPSTTPDSTGYGFMNPSWLPQLSSEPSSSTSSLSQPNSSSTTETITQTFETELEKNKIKNSIFLSALTSLQSSSRSTSLPASASSSSSHRKSNSQIQSSQQVEQSFHELLLEEKELKQIQHSKVATASSAVASSSSLPSSSHAPGLSHPFASASSSSSLRSKKVISSTAQDEWLTLMREEESMKRLVEDKKKTKLITKKKKTIKSSDSHEKRK